MNTFWWILLGILIGWLVEWVIDWLYWRRKTAALSVEQRGAALSPVSDELAELRRENAALRVRIARYNAAPDDLKIIRGIGPEIERRLHEAGITTFAQLGELTPADLERILGSTIKRLADEDSLLAQARELAQKRQ